MKINSTHLRLVGSSPDQVGIIARVASFIADHGGNITESNQYEDVRSKTFFMRYGIELLDTKMSASEFAITFRSLADELRMEWHVTDLASKPRIVLLVSKFDHCLAHLLHRWKGGDLRFDIPCVISNHETLRELVEWYGIPYHHVPVPKESEAKQAAFEKTAELIEQAEPDTIVLARYMQIFPAWLCKKYRHKVINIHHSFLPSFIGAKPYHQADEREVDRRNLPLRLTENLDAGPIIE